MSTGPGRGVGPSEGEEPDVRPPIDSEKLSVAFERRAELRLKLVRVDFVGGDDRGFHLTWVTAGGFGLTTFYLAEDDATVLCETETMGREFVLNVVSTFARQCPSQEWPQLLKTFGSAEVLVGASVPSHGRW